MSMLRRRSRVERRRTTRGLAAAGALLIVAACSGTLVPVTPTPAAPTKAPSAALETPIAPTATPAESGTASPTAVASPSASAQPITVELAIETAAGAKEFSFVPTALEAPAGSTIKLQLTNKTNPDDEIGHNWVLVKPGQEDSVLANGIAAGDDRDWLQEDDPGIIAATRLIEGDEHHAVTFDAPTAGSYTFVCTFPEHYAGGMKGTLTVS